MLVALLKCSAQGKWSLDSTALPLQPEKKKSLLQKRSKPGVNEESINALRQNLSHPGKVLVVRGKSLPYAAEEILIIADSSHNRYVIVDAATHTFIEQIGSGKMGADDGSFATCSFNHVQGVCAFQNKKEEYCLLLCDVKNHTIRLANLHTKTVERVVGTSGVRGFDMEGGKPLHEQ